MKKWHQLAEEKSAVDQQTQDIHQKFRMNEISKEFGQLSGEELFKPITKRLDEKSSATAEEEEEEEHEVPDYTMDEFDENNPFGDEFRPDAPTPAPSPEPSHHQPHHHHHHQRHQPHIMKLLMMIIFHNRPHH